MEQILILENDWMFSAQICHTLDAAGYIPTAVYSLEKARRLLQTGNFSLVLSELQGPDGGGLELCRMADKRNEFPNRIRIFLMAEKSDQPETEQALLEALALGAEDFLIRPFGMKLLVKKIERILKPVNTQEFQDSFLSLDFLSMTAFRKGERLPLTLNEFKILRILTENKGKIVTRQMLLEQLWDVNGNFVDDHTLTVNMTRLRSKLEDQAHRYIRTIRGIGYLWTGEALTSQASLQNPS